MGHNMSFKFLLLVLSRTNGSLLGSLCRVIIQHACIAKTRDTHAQTDWLASGIGSASGDVSATDDEVTIGQRVVDKVVTVEVVEIWGQDSISGGLREAGV